MLKRMVLLAVVVALTTTSPTLAQRGPGGPMGPNTRGPGGFGGPGGPPEQVRKLQAEIEELQAEIKKLSSALRTPKDTPKDAPKGPPKGGLMPPAMGGGFGGMGGFVPPKAGGGFGGPPKGGFGPMGGFSGPPMGMGGPREANRRPNDVRTLEAQLERLRNQSKMIDEQIKATEAKIRDAKQTETRKESPRPASVEQRLERIERLLSELQAERRKR